MKPLSPWSVKGVDDDAREAARNAAQATGLTLGAWIDRAIRKSTGLMPISPNSSEGTTDSTTFSQAWADHRGDSFEVDHSSTPEAEASSSGAGEPAGPTIEPTPDHEDPEAVPTSFDLQVDPEERFGAGLEPVTTPRPRQWPSFTGLRRAGPRTIGATALVLVLGAGLLVYLISFVGSDDTDPTTPATDGMTARATSTPPPPTPADRRRADTTPPTEPGVLEMLTASAEQGDAVAQHDLAVRYMDGGTVARDDKLAVKWFERAASQGMAAAQHRLAGMFAEGRGVAADVNRAAMWHTRAASQGHPGSQHALALAYEAGLGVKPSEASAVQWLERTARAGNLPSQVLLAERYDKGRGVARDPAKAREWFVRAAAKGHAGAASRLKQQVAKTESGPPAPPSTTPSAKPALPPGTLLDKAGISEVQLLLTRLAFKPGPADGVLGRRTVREIKLYQSFAGLPDDGKATVGLLSELREMVRGMSSATPSPAAN